MATLFNVTPSSLHSSSLVLLDKETAQDSSSKDLTPRIHNWVSYELAELIAHLASDEDLEERGTPVILKGDGSFLMDCLRLNQVAVPDSHVGTLIPRPLLSYGMSHVRTVNDVCSILRDWGEYALAERIAYFASDEDLEDGDIPVTPESACGFLEFFGAVKSEGRLSLTCSPEGWLCTVWRFPDQRRASLWFLDTDRVMLAATDAAGEFIGIDGGGEIGSRLVVTTKLVQAGLLTWFSDTLTSASFYPVTTLLDTAGGEIWTKMGSLWRERFYSETTSVTFPPIGWSTSTHSTGHSRVTALSSL